jgi:hypothetical protein
MAIRRAVLLIADIGKGLRLAKQGRRRVLLGTTAASLNIAASRWGMFTSRRQACKCCYRLEAVVAVVAEGPQEKGR